MNCILLLIANILVKVTVEPSVSTKPYIHRKTYTNTENSNIITANTFTRLIQLTFNFTTKAESFSNRPKLTWHVTTQKFELILILLLCTRKYPTSAYLGDKTYLFLYPFLFLCKSFRKIFTYCIWPLVSYCLSYASTHLKSSM